MSQEITKEHENSCKGPNELGNYKSLAGNYATGVVARFIGFLDVVAQFIGLPRRFSDEPKW